MHISLSLSIYFFTFVPIYLFYSLFPSVPPLSRSSVLTLRSHLPASLSSPFLRSSSTKTNNTGSASGFLWHNSGERRCRVRRNFLFHFLRFLHFPPWLTTLSHSSYIRSMYTIHYHFISRIPEEKTRDSGKTKRQVASTRNDVFSLSARMRLVQKRAGKTYYTLCISQELSDLR